jgi:hypothetical protein
MERRPTYERFIEAREQSTDSTFAGYGPWPGPTGWASLGNDDFEPLKKS